MMCHNLLNLQNLYREKLTGFSLSEKKSLTFFFDNLLYEKYFSSGIYWFGTYWNLLEITKTYTKFCAPFIIIVSCKSRLNSEKKLKDQDLIFGENLKKSLKIIHKISYLLVK